MNSKIPLASGAKKSYIEAPKKEYLIGVGPAAHFDRVFSVHRNARKALDWIAAEVVQKKAWFICDFVMAALFDAAGEPACWCGL